ncbi:hypothetical protein [Marinitenerispora sediminis]|uniref:Uncharacterized protein n=1 Tax=Marinitenerispora sediminis TaxID=1931232 RepID=A0A368SYM7_9ACTN|nr:hypothetical protein [Marinitenerispora sediminis]RCV47659.1 hypothetical protein DEF28_25665 [Marinitenerispora sediminis]RCV48101.1 hypothetical protein DEF23_25585 [Marinitenerispora sediminis]RCV49568.1 hypothetical protein DEF24_25110 [Marinitenerispora sediminis]
MTEQPEWERLPTEELHRRAVTLARRRWDVGFFWRLLRSIPAAEAAAGRLDASEASVAKVSGLVSELLAARHGDPQLQEALRPIYIDYLAEHAEP